MQTQCFSLRKVYRTGLQFADYGRLGGIKGLPYYDLERNMGRMGGHTALNIARRLMWYGMVDTGSGHNSNSSHLSVLIWGTAMATISPPPVPSRLL